MDSVPKSFTHKVGPLATSFKELLLSVYKMVANQQAISLLSNTSLFHYLKPELKCRFQIPVRQSVHTHGASISREIETNV